MITADKLVEGYYWVAQSQKKPKPRIAYLVRGANENWLIHWFDHRSSESYELKDYIDGVIISHIEVPV